ncbi:MAG TPA: L-type lectin-domain containing protein [Candidatus Binatia bacterium]|nr:L-type lectin-domain containing protein [Candidatus Binatia bacterium]
MRPAIRLWLFTLAIIPLLLGELLNAQQVRFFPDFTTPHAANGIAFNGTSRLKAYQGNVVLRLTDDSTNSEQSSAYFKIPQEVDQGFTTYFAFKFHNPTTCCNPGDGFAFILQNSSATDPTEGASGSGLTALGADDGGMGYSGINNSLAVEFDIFGDAWDPNSNHVSIQTCGGDPSQFNSPVHLPGDYTIGQNDHVTSCLLSEGAINTSIPVLGGTCNEDGCSDGAIHQVVIEYTPPAPNQQFGLLQVWLDPMFIPGTQTPVMGAPTVISVPYNIVFSESNPTGLQLASHNSLLVGFTASQPETPDSRKAGGGEASGGTTTDIIAWEFTTHSPVQVTQVIPPGGTEADYVFGAHQAGVTYPTDFNNPGNITMTVLETPVNQQTFHQQRLVGTPFAAENCIIYNQTGGNCVVYSVTCNDSNGNQVTCPTESEPTIAICTKYTTSEPQSQNFADYLSADPIGSNNWCSIFTALIPNNDPVTSGKGTGFSDLVATFSPFPPGPSCFGGLKSAIQQIKKTTSPPSSPASFCPPIQ